jgi:hypothetical protein
MAAFTASWVFSVQRLGSSGMGPGYRSNKKVDALTLKFLREAPVATGIAHYTADDAGAPHRPSAAPMSDGRSDGPGGHPGPVPGEDDPPEAVDHDDDVEDVDDPHDVNDTADADDTHDLDDPSDFDDVDEDGWVPPARSVSHGRIVAGLICAAIGILAAVLAVRAASDDDTDASATTTTAVQLAGTTPDGAATSVPSPGWPEAVRGRPQQFGPEGPPPGSAGDLEPGWYLWSDFHDWHLWLVGGEGVDASAVVTTNAALTLKSTYGDAEVAPAEGSATVRRGASTAPIAGIDFNPGFYGDQITVTVTGDLPLHTGQGATEATSPLALERRPET